jgi:hypothetical protein
MSTTKVARKAKESFSQEEDILISRFVKRNGMNKISELISRLPNRTARQTRERYRLYLDPSVLQTPFTCEEDMNLMQYVQEIGPKWSKISKQMKGRTDVKLKYRFRRLSKNKIIHLPQQIESQIIQQPNFGFQLPPSKSETQKQESLNLRSVFEPNDEPNFNQTLNNEK